MAYGKTAYGKYVRATADLGATAEPGVLLLTVPEAAASLGRPAPSLYRWIARGWLRPSRREPLLITQEEVERFRRENLD